MERSDRAIASTTQDEHLATKNETANSRMGLKYWESVTSDINGMLGGIPTVPGFGSVSRIDLQGSRTFLARLGVGIKNERKPVAKAVDVGAGIGRITEGLLLHVADSVDVVEPVAKFTDRLKTKKGVCDIFNVGLEDWKATEGAQYDLIWIQWCLGYLSDDEIVDCLKRCKTTLRDDSSLVVIKENLSSGNEKMIDDVDGSVTRRDEDFRKLFTLAGLNLVKTDVQRGFPEIPPKRLLPVRMYALKA
ncbi:hypothetical protein VHEMI04428 [[Torrubiella] hemipterigena]|uniref:Alpha N-terminal protein methyltransferase 1 n=1 Tax=[Torrubiella] hemipterigena TaxID=1531966 RepID=A0A0A1TG95_9HYPO|nr:hypothetical protein VHEMI04428 [[Torrubiella] hemipterigena]